MFPVTQSAFTRGFSRHEERLGLFRRVVPALEVAASIVISPALARIFGPVAADEDAAKPFGINRAAQRLILRGQFDLARTPFRRESVSVRS